MSDKEILKLLSGRDPDAVSELQKKYGNYCRTVAFNILGSAEDAEECVNDAYLKVWNSGSPDNISDLKKYIAAVVRNTAINRFKEQRRLKRCSGDVTESITDAENAAIPEQDPIDRLTVSALISEYLHSLPKEKRQIFVARYYYAASISEIAGKLDIPEGTVNSSLGRIRKGLQEFLAKEGIDV